MPRRCQPGPSGSSPSASLAERCHARVHAGLLYIVGSDEEGWRFEDKAGKDLHATPAAPGRYLGGRKLIDRTPSPIPVRTRGIPAEIDPSWWRRHRHLVRWSDSHGAFELQAGPAMEDDDPGGVAQCATRARALA